MPPLELALTMPPRTLAFQALTRVYEVAPATLKRYFLERLKILRLRAGENLPKAQARYKKSYDLGLVRKNTDLSVGDEAYLRVDNTDVGRNHKLESLVPGPYRVLKNAVTTLRLNIGEKTVRELSDRVTRSPTRSRPSTPTPTTETPSDPVTPPQAREKDALPRKPKPPRRVRFALPEFIPDPGPREKEYVVDRLVDAQINDRDSRSSTRSGYDPAEDTWEDKNELPILFIRRYWRAKVISTLEREHTLY
jgi:hypothetical protein